MEIRKKLPYITNNLESVAKKYPKQWESYKAFSEQYPGDCLQMDGIVCPEIWENQKLKIMTFLKDSYRKKMDKYICTFILDLCNDELFNYNKRKIATWWNLLKWVNAIRVSLGESEIKDLQSIAHMNISKLACDGNESVYTRKGVLSEALDKDGGLLYQQYKAINPNIVICGNTYPYFLQLLSKHSNDKLEEKVIFKKSLRGKEPLYCYLIGRTIVFSAYHPCILNTKPEDFQSVISEHKQEIQEALGI